MPVATRVWRVTTGDQLEELKRASLNLESRLEKWLAQDIGILSTDLLVIGQQVETTFGGVIDLLCLDRQGDVVVVELKRDKTPRQITAQVLDYASWVNGLDHEEIAKRANSYFSKTNSSLDKAFRNRFGVRPPAILNEEHSMLIVGGEIDQTSARIIRYLSDRHSIRINAATFSFLAADTEGSEYLARVFLLEPDEVERRASRSSKRERNLTPDELAEKAATAGVGGLYDPLANALAAHLSGRTTRSSLSFYARLDEGWKAAFTLIPDESDAQRGLRFHAYIYRLAAYLNVEAAAVEAHLPGSREKWKYYETADDDLSGAAGFFKTTEEVARFLSLFQSGSQPQGNRTQSSTGTPALYPRLPPLMPSGSASELLTAERQERSE
jgi:hypothetical protein